MIPILFLVASVLAADMKLSYPTTLGPGDPPSIFVTLPRPAEILRLDCEVGGDTRSWERAGVAANEQLTFSWDRDPSVTHAECTIQVRFRDGTAEGMVVSLDYSYGDPLEVDLSQASVDLEANTLKVGVTAPVKRARVTAYGVGRTRLDQQEFPLEGGPGTIEIPWVGDPDEVVLLEVKVYGDSAWAGFEFSPWFLDIPHEDVHFETDSAEIPEDEAWKLEKTLEDLHEVIEKYGDLVPVKLYIAGCTDTVGSAAHNRDLSRRRARAIAHWLRQHGYTHPVFYHGFGESLLAVPTPDATDEAANRRALYIVSAHPPPAGSGIPQVQWTRLP